MLSFTAYGFLFFFAKKLLHFIVFYPTTDRNYQTSWKMSEGAVWSGSVLFAIPLSI